MNLDFKKIEKQMLGIECEYDIFQELGL